MQKTVIFIISVMLYTSLVWAQGLIDVYKTGEIVMEPDANFGVHDNWFDQNDNRKTDLEAFTNMVISPDANLFILDRKNHEILQFDQNGVFVKKIALKTTISTSVYDWVDQLDLLDNKYLLIRRYSNIRVINLTGDLVKVVEFDYPLYDITALKNNKVGIKGYIQLKGDRTKWHVAIVDIETEIETPVTSFIEADRKEGFSFKTDKGWLGLSNPKRRPRVYLSRTLEGNLIVGNSGNPELVVYSLEGKQLYKINLNYSQLPVSQEEKEQYYQSLQEQIKRLKAPDSLLEVIKSPDFYYQHMPYYYGFKVDSDDNILVFKYTREKNHVFRVYQVYSKEGKFICETTLAPGEFETPGLRLLNFHRGKLYGLLNVKDEKQVRLVRVNLQ